jgi:hypothetical protein
MNKDDAIYQIMKMISNRSQLQPKGTTIRYTAGQEGLPDVSPREEISLLNLLESEGLIKITGNFTEYE